MEIRSLANVKALAVFLVPAVVLLSAACGGAERSQAAGSGGEETAAPPGSPGGPGSVEVDVCALVPLSAVAHALGHDSANALAESNQGQWTSDCTYTFVRGDSREYAMIWVYPRDLWAPEKDSVIEELPGLGDAAYRSTAGTLAQVKMLVGGRFFDTRASTPEGARRLAELVAAGQAGD